MKHSCTIHQCTHTHSHTHFYFSFFPLLSCLCLLLSSLMSHTLHILWRPCLLLLLTFLSPCCSISVLLLYSMHSPPLWSHLSSSLLSPLLPRGVRAKLKWKGYKGKWSSGNRCKWFVSWSWLLRQLVALLAAAETFRIFPDIFTILLYCTAFNHYELHLNKSSCQTGFLLTWPLYQLERQKCVNVKNPISQSWLFPSDKSSPKTNGFCLGP